MIRPEPLQPPPTGRKRDWRRRPVPERTNARFGRSFEFEQHFLRGSSRMRTRVGSALPAMTALASDQVRAGRPERMRSSHEPAHFALA